MEKHWFDTRTGELLGDEAYTQRTEGSLDDSNHIRPLGEILTSKKFDLDPTPYGHLPHKTKRQSRKACLEYAQFVLNIVHQANPDEILRTKHFERMVKLGLGLGYRAVLAGGGVDNMWELRRELGQEWFSEPGTYDNWSIDEFIANAKTLQSTFTRDRPPKPTYEDYQSWAQAGNGPSAKAIEARLPGGIKRLNEEIGFTYFRDKTPHELLEWGARVIRANDGFVPNHLFTTILARRRQSPHPKPLSNRYGAPLPDFWEDANEFYLSQIAQDESRLEDKVATFVRLQAEDAGSHNGLIHPITLDFMGRYEVTRECISGLSHAQATRIAATTSRSTFIPTLRKAKPSLTAGFVESTAISLDCFDDIWPPYQDDRSKLKVSPAELARAKRIQADRRHKYPYTSRGVSYRRLAATGQG